MKTVNLVVMFSALSSCIIQANESTWTLENREWEAKQVRLWEDNLAKASSLPPSEKFEALALGLLNMGHRVSMTEHSQAVNQIYQRLQQEFLSIPGHATYYRDKINALREQLLAGNLGLEDWGDKKSPYFKVLGHLPSEEAVEVLCGFAGDDFATGGHLNPKNAHIPGMKDWRFSDYDVDFTVCLSAMNALRSLQIDDAPSAVGIDAEKSALVWRQWRQEVKAGKRKYRFKGSSVEHPLDAPPGSFREQRRPERRPESSPGTKAAEKPMPSSAENQATELKSPQWPIWAGIGAVILALAAYLLKRCGRR